MRIMPNQEPEASTPDGISRGDWEMVHQCAVDIATAADDDVASQQSTRRLLQMLERLEHRYGPLPSILATRADYTEDASGRLALYQAAYDVASSREDARNLVWVASSLAELYAEELRDPTSAGEWLDRLEAHLAAYEDEDERVELARLRGIVELLGGAGQRPSSLGPERD